MSYYDSLRAVHLFKAAEEAEKRVSEIGAKLGNGDLKFSPAARAFLEGLQAEAIGAAPRLREEASQARRDVIQNSQKP